MAEESNKEKQRPPITFEELQLKMYHPFPSNPRLFGSVLVTGSNNESREIISQSLSFIPWTLRQSVNGTVSEDASFPTTSYLDLRRQQNRAWANDRLSKGNEKFYLDPVKADSFYQEGLDLVPDHIELLVAQAKLWMQRRNRPLAAKAQLQECLQLDPDHKSAKELLGRLERLDASRRGGAPKRVPQTTLETSSAFQDALMERNLAMDTTSALEASAEKLDEHSVVSSGRKDTKKKKKKKRKSKKKSKYRKKHDKKRRRKRKRYEYSSTDDSSSSSDESHVDSLEDKRDRNGSTGKRRDRERKHKRKRHRRRHDSDISSSDASAAEVKPTSSPCKEGDDRNRDAGDGWNPDNFKDSLGKQHKEDGMSSSDHELKREDNKDDGKSQRKPSTAS
jgi:hypothetical protein